MSLLQNFRTTLNMRTIWSNPLLSHVDQNLLVDLSCYLVVFTAVPERGVFPSKFSVLSLLQFNTDLHHSMCNIIVIAFWKAYMTPGPLLFSRMLYNILPNFLVHWILCLYLAYHHLHWRFYFEKWVNHA